MCVGHYFCEPLPCSRAAVYPRHKNSFFPDCSWTRQQGPGAARTMLFYRLRYSTIVGYCVYYRLSCVLHWPFLSSHCLHHQTKANVCENVAINSDDYFLQSINSITLCILRFTARLLLLKLLIKYAYFSLYKENKILIFPFHVGQSVSFVIQMLL